MDLSKISIKYHLFSWKTKGFLVIFIILIILISFLYFQNLKLQSKLDENKTIDYKELYNKFVDRNKKIDSLYEIAKEKDEVLRKKEKFYHKKIRNLTDQIFFLNTALDENIKTIDSLFKIRVININGKKDMTKDEIEKYLYKEFNYINIDSVLRK